MLCVGVTVLIGVYLLFVGDGVVLPMVLDLRVPFLVAGRLDFIGHWLHQHLPELIVGFPQIIHTQYISIKTFYYSSINIQ